MRSNIGEKIIQQIIKRDKLFLLLLFGVGLFFFIQPLRHFEEELLKSNSIADARLYAQSLSSFRVIYTREVVTKALERGLKVSHDFEGDVNAIPLPASFSMMLGHEISKRIHGGEVQLYSAYPFPWRRMTGGLTDDFKTRAWEALQDKSRTEYIEFFTENNKKFIRYAVPDVLQPSCVDCHNQHPQSPKTGWKAGDIRGVLEVRRPVSLISKNISTAFSNTVLMVLAIIGIFLVIIYFIISTLRKKIIILDQQADVIKAHQASLISASRLTALGEMAGGIAHEINTPLGIIMAASNSLRKMIERKQFEDPRLFKNVDHIDKTTERIASIIKGLRTVSRDASDDEISTCQFNEILSDTLDLCREKLRFYEIDLKVDLTQPAFATSFRGNKIQLCQVFLNLISNSIDAIKDLPEKWITIEASLNRKMLVITFTDSGHGIPAKVREKMFEPFYTTKKIGHGTGLGLSISRTILAKHNGVMRLDTTHKHTRFIIELPIKDEDAKK